MTTDTPKKSSAQQNKAKSNEKKGFARVSSAQTFGLDAHIVTVEVDVIHGMHTFSIVGLPDKAVKESRDRVSAAIRNSGILSPKKKSKKIVVSLAPADIKKEGPAFDLAIALAILKAVKPDIDSAGKRQGITVETDGKLFLGELGLDGSLRPIKGVLRLVEKARNAGFKEIYLPTANAEEAALIDGITIYPAPSLTRVIEHLTGEGKSLIAQGETSIPLTQDVDYLDFSYIKGQESAKRGLEIAGAGGHNIAMYGPPGTGKSMLARAFAGILPPLSFEDMLEVTGIHSIAGVLTEPLVLMPPFRAPHHTSSHTAIIGGGAYPKPGDITLAHKGVLFLDEFPEFDRRVVESLRQPLEDGTVRVSRSKGSVTFPANVILVAAMNPCPCGFYGTHRPCTCMPAALERYKRKLSGPIIDRIDLWVEVGAVDHDKLLDEKPSGEKSEDIRERIWQARAYQRKRYGAQSDVRTNSDMNVKDLSKFVELSNECKDLLKRAAVQHNLSARAHHRTIKIARTIADLEGSEHIESAHIMEALQYRPKQNV